MVNPRTHFAAVRKYRNYRAQMHDKMRQFALEKKGRGAMRYIAGVTEILAEVGLLVMVHQKRTAKLEPRAMSLYALTSSRCLSPKKYMSILVIFSTKPRSFVRQSSRNVWKPWSDMYVCKILIQYIS